MKHMKRTISMLTALVMLFTTMAFASAADQTDPTLDALLADASYIESVVLDDGTEIIFAVVPIPTDAARAGVTIPSAWARPKATQSFQCVAADGNYLNIRTANIGDTMMRVTDTIYAPGSKPVGTGREVPPGDAFITYTNGTSSTGLTIKVETTIEAVNDSSANYSYVADQSWVS